MNVTDEVVEWWHDYIWCVSSEREGYGFKLYLWFNSHAGTHDGFDNVVVGPAPNGTSERPDAYATVPRLDFDARGFEKNLQAFVEELNQLM